MGYSCDQCGKAYNTNAALTKHRKRTHEGIKDYAVGYKNGGKQKPQSNQATKRAKPTSNARQNSSSNMPSYSRRVQQAPQKFSCHSSTPAYSAKMLNPAIDVW